MLYAEYLLDMRSLAIWTSVEKMKYKLKNNNENLRKYRDIHFIKEWPSQALVKRYDEVRKVAIQIEDQLEKVGFDEQEEKQELTEKYERTLRLIELLEDEGRKRSILYFMPWEEVEEICERIFNDKRKFKLVPKGYTPQA